MHQFYENVFSTIHRFISITKCSIRYNKFRKNTLNWYFYWKIVYVLLLFFQSLSEIFNRFVAEVMFLGGTVRVKECEKRPKTIYRIKIYCRFFFVFFFFFDFLFFPFSMFPFSPLSPETFSVFDRKKTGDLLESLEKKTAHSSSKSN